ncbi:hypothetical protein N7527_006126 [Penicillium freii]|nr:hypothetical protein N7527_006126 [Penicillium freii]
MLDEAFNWSKLFFELPQDEKPEAPHLEGGRFTEGKGGPAEGGLTGFRDFMLRFYWEYSRVGGEILQALAVGLKLDENHLLEKHSEAVETERAARCPAHTDWSSITLLFQDDFGGLEVEDLSSPATFVSPTPIKNATVMNVEDMYFAEVE